MATPRGKPRYKDDSADGRALNDALNAEKEATALVDSLKPIVYDAMVKEKGEEDIIVELEDFILSRSVTPVTTVDVDTLSVWCPDYKEKLAVMRSTEIEAAIKEASEKLRRKLLVAPPTEAEFDALMVMEGLGARAHILKGTIVTRGATYAYGARAEGRGV